jgi:glyoxylase-like metal-dependent hydrolase (beta-lactamase superfamily II)
LAAAGLTSAGIIAMGGASEKPAGNASGFEIQKLAEGVYAAVRTDPPGLMVDGNCVFIVNDEEVVVVDAPEAAGDLIPVLRSLTPKPVRFVVNTHWHDDHITGNALYRKTYPGVEFIGHTALREYLPATGAKNRKAMIEGAPGFMAYIRSQMEQGKSLSGDPITEEERASYESDGRLVDRYMAEVPNSEVVLPTIAVEDRLTLYRGGRRIEILHLGRAHTSGDLVVFLPEERILVAGDLVVWPVPLVGAEQSHVAEWSATLEKMLALNPSIIVPGHGPVLRDSLYVSQMIRLFSSVTDQVRSAVARGETLETARKSVDLREQKSLFAGDSKVRAFLFEQYVAGPAVASAYVDLSLEKPISK